MRHFVIFIFMILTFLPIPSYAKRVALLIGNTEYQYENKLANPENDARLLQGVLKNDLQFDDVQLVHNANIRQLYQSIEQFKQKAQDADVALIYFSGHGQQTEDKQNYLLATDAKIEHLSDLKIGAINSDQLLEVTQGAKTRLVILDACRDRPNSGFKSATKGLSRSNDPTGQGLLVAYATEDGKVAQDGRAGENSPYAIALAQALRKTNKSILAMFDEVADLVQKATQGQQRPTRSGNLRVDIYFIQPTIIIEPAPIVPMINAEVVLWESIQNSIEIADYQAYLKQYPNGQFSHLAQARIQKYSQPIVPLAPEPIHPVITESSFIAPETILSASDQELMTKGMWRDPQTNLIWMRCSLGQTWDGSSCTGNAKSYDWQAAQEAIVNLNKNGGFAGYNDWQLPEIESLGRLRVCDKGFESTVEVPNKTGKMTIPLMCKSVLLGKNTHAMIDLDIFPNTEKMRNYWSQTSSNKNRAWQIFFGAGISMLTDKNEHHHIRLMRVSQ